MLGNHPSVKIFSMDYTWLLVAPRSKPRKHLSLHSCSLGVYEELLVVCRNSWRTQALPQMLEQPGWAFLKYVKYMSNQYTVPKTCKLDKVREGCTSAQKKGKSMAVWLILHRGIFPKGGMASLNIYVKPFVWYFHARQYQNMDRLIALEFFDR